MHGGAGGGERLGGGSGLGLVDLIGRAQAGELGARGFEGGDHLVAALEAVIADGLDAAGFVEVLGEGGPRGEVGQSAEVGEEHLRPRAGLGEDGVGRVAQGFERRGQPRRGQRLEGRGGGDRRCGHGRDVEHLHRRLAEVGEIAGAGERVLAPGDGLLPRRARRRHLALEQPLFERGRGAAGSFDLLEQRPGFLGHLRRQRLDAATAGGRIGDAVEVRLFQQDELQVARDAARETVGQAARQRERQHADRVGAADAGGGDGDGCAQHVHVGVARGHGAPRRFGGNERRPRRQAAGLFDARPQLPQRAEFGDGEEFVGVGGQHK